MSLKIEGPKNHQIFSFVGKSTIQGFCSQEAEKPVEKKKKFVYCPKDKRGKICVEKF